MEVESTVAGTLVEIVVESGMVAVGEPIGWVEGEDDGGGFGDLLTAPEPRARSRRPRPSRSPGPSTAGDARARARAAAPERHRARRPPRPRAWPASGASTWPTVTPTGPGRPGARRRRRGARSRRAAAARPPAAAPAAPPRRAAPRRRTSGPPRGDRPQRRDPRGRGPHDDAERRDPAVHRVARAAPRRRQRDAATACPGPRCCCARTPRRCARCPSCCAAGRTTAPPRPVRPRSRWPWPPTAGCWCRRSASPTSATPPTSTPRSARWSRSAQKGRLDRAYLGIANGSLSNLGGLGVDRFQALLTPPQASVLSLGSIKQRPVAVPGGVGHRAHRARPASPSTTGWPTAPTRPSCWTGMSTRLARGLGRTAVTRIGPATP